MQAYKIVIRFRERNINGYVQKFEGSHYDVFFQDEEILQSMGGMISFDADTKFKSARNTTADDANRFYKLVSEKLK